GPSRLAEHLHPIGGGHPRRGPRDRPGTPPDGHGAPSQRLEVGEAALFRAVVGTGAVGPPGRAGRPRRPSSPRSGGRRRSPSEPEDALNARPDRVDAVVLVGGLGTRLRPLTLSAPKPMLPTAGVPLLAHLLSRIRDAGVQHIVLGTCYNAELVRAVLGDGGEFGLSIDYVQEEQPLDTAGGIRNA